MRDRDAAYREPVNIITQMTGTSRDVIAIGQKTPLITINPNMWRNSLQEIFTTQNLSGRGSKNTLRINPKASLSWLIKEPMRSESRKRFRNIPMTISHIGEQLASKVKCANPEHISRVTGLNVHLTKSAIKVAEVARLVANIDTNKSSSLKDINSAAIKDALSCLVNKVTFLFNRCL